MPKILEEWHAELAKSEPQEEEAEDEGLKVGFGMKRQRLKSSLCYLPVR